MSRGAGILAGKAFILLTIKNRTKKDLLQAQRDLQKFALKLGVLGGALVLGGRAFSGLFLRAAKEFSTFEQLIGRFQSVFLDLSGEATKFADTLAAGISQSVLIIKDQLAQTQALFQGFGFEAAVALPLTQALVSGAQDLLAFDDNLQSAQQGLDKLLGGLTGSNVRGVRSFGADVTEAAVALELLSLGINKTAVEASQQEKNIARFSILLRALGRAGVTGQAAREINTLASRFRALQGALKEALAAIGAGFGNQLATILNGFKGLLKSIQTFASENPRVFQALALAGPIMIGLGAAALTAAAGVFAFGAVLGSLGTIGSVLSGLAAPIAVVTGVSVAVVALVKNVEGLQDVLGDISQNFKTAFAGAAEGFGAVNDALAIGNLAQAAKIGSLTLKIAFEEAFGDIRDAWLSVQDDIAAGFTILTGFLSDSLKSTLNAVEVGLTGAGLIGGFAVQAQVSPLITELKKAQEQLTRGTEVPDILAIQFQDETDRKQAQAAVERGMRAELALQKEILALQQAGEVAEQLRLKSAQKAGREAADAAEKKRAEEVKAFQEEQERLEAEEKLAKKFKPFSEGTFSGVAAKQAFGPSVSIAKASLKKQEEQVDLTKIIVEVLKANNLLVPGP